MTAAVPQLPPAVAACVVDKPLHFAFIYRVDYFVEYVKQPSLAICNNLHDFQDLIIIRKVSVNENFTIL